MKQEKAGDEKVCACVGGGGGLASCPARHHECRPAPLSPAESPLPGVPAASLLPVLLAASSLECPRHCWSRSRQPGPPLPPPSPTCTPTPPHPWAHTHTPSPGAPSRAPLQTLPGSLVGFSVNGAWQGAAWADFAEGTYYPTASLYTMPDQVRPLHGTCPASMHLLVVCPCLWCVVVFAGQGACKH